MLKLFKVISIAILTSIFSFQVEANDRACFMENLSDGEDDPLRFQVKYDDDASPFEENIQWDRRRFEEYAYRLTPKTHIPVVYRGLHAQYEKATGVKLDVRLQTQLITFLAEKGIPPQELQRIGGGLQGELFTHPKLGNSAIKVVASYLDGVRLLVPDGENLVLLGKEKVEKRSITNFRELYRQSLAKMGAAAPEKEGHYQEYLDNILRIHRSAASQSLHRAYQMMLPGLISGQAKMDYFDFAHVSMIGNGFFLREYYPDSTIGRTGALEQIQEFLSSKKIADKQLDEALQKASKHSPVLGELVISLVGNAPSYFASPTLMQSSQERTRAFIIFDLD